MDSLLEKVNAVKTARGWTFDQAFRHVLSQENVTASFGRPKPGAGDAVLVAVAVADAELPKPKPKSKGVLVTGAFYNLLPGAEEEE